MRQMTGLANKQQQRHIHDEKLKCINELNKLGMIKMPDGRSFEECTLYTLQYTLVANGYVPSDAT